jgi:hypothetical protein
MPYSSVSEIPESVKKRIKSPKKRRQWMHVFNSTHAKTGNESRSFAAANSVAGKKESLLEAQKAFLYDTYEVHQRQLPQDAAGYDPYGAKDGIGCASCHWFIAPSSCVLVAGDVSPTGVSSLYASASEMVDTIMESYDDAESKPSIVSRIASFFKKDKNKAPALSPFVLFRDNKDNLRFVAVYSNIFEDKHKQILTTESHKEYVDWVSESGLYPDLHIWHAGDGSKIGSTDMVDFVDGFSFAAGIIDPEKEEIAYKAAENDPGVSHGFVGLLQTSTGLWNKYRSFEISVLPAWAAGNETLDVLYAPGSKELFMPFDTKKRAYFLSLGLDEATINEWEASAKEQGDNLRKLNIAHRSSEAPPKPVPPKPEEEEENQEESTTSTTQPIPEPEPEPEPLPSQEGALATKSELAWFAKSFAESNKTIAALANSLVTLTETVKSIQTDMTTLKKPADQRSADEWMALATATPGGFIATQSKANKPAEEENKAADDFFGTIVMGQVNKHLGIGGS